MGKVGIPTSTQLVVQSVGLTGVHPNVYMRGKPIHTRGINKGTHKQS